MKEIIGLIVFALGVMAADSESLIVPLALVAIGIWLMRGMIYEEISKEDSEQSR